MSKHKCSECGDRIDQSDPHAGYGMCAECLHDALRSGWDPSDKVREVVRRFREHADEIMPERDEAVVDFEGEASEMEADTWLAAADELAAAFGIVNEGDPSEVTQ